ncbi:protease modulator HflC [Halieaceae bacterium IMCC14734]|uniref:Protein HflC n=1 Tax=Candidatus Litorirhabdus singularis TaxID=2518993 RepID=A0ABT3TK97_9GAMM|nr:protease modulator HflC [Candidatus Litorirhabdus singularis]MCX2982733.1 protease modulator HflC [Candidatus Litorirhabdus singularis]
MNTKSLVAVLLAVFGLVLISNSLFIIKETERAVMLRFGEVVRPDIEPGLHVKIPFVNSVRVFDGRVLTVDARPERYLTLEKKAVVVDSFAKWKVSDVAKYYTATSGDENRAQALLAQRINNGLRNEVAVRTLHEVVSGQRDELMLSLTNSLNEVANAELGVEVVDVRVKQIDLPPAVSESVFLRMNAEREKEARELRSQGSELAEGIRASADREVTILKAGAYRDAELIRGDGDAEAASIYSTAFNQDSEFYSFTRSLRAYQDAFRSKGDIILVEPDSDFFKYLKNPGGAN